MSPDAWGTVLGSGDGWPWIRAKALPLYCILHSGRGVYLPPSHFCRSPFALDSWRKIAIMLKTPNRGYCLCPIREALPTLSARSSSNYCTLHWRAVLIFVATLFPVAGNTVLEQVFRQICLAYLVHATLGDMTFRKILQHA